MNTQTYVGTLAVEVCCKCGMAFGMPRDFQNECLQDHRTFYCPSGHNQHYIGKTEEEKLRERLEWKDRQLANKDEDLRSMTASRNALKGVNTKMKNRVKNGVCPCCNRQFQNLKRHMSSQHPDFGKKDEQ